MPDTHPCYALPKGYRVDDTSLTAGPGYPDAAAFMQRVARADGGRFVRADENASLSVTILRAIFDD